ncbi:phage tail spike protein [Salibacterium lacus]|uniref:Phage tail spike protein n=1 Tax=Salibacterium lacus TaxID=1898109 RepID=A0ABW5T259_9BACI
MANVDYIYLYDEYEEYFNSNGIAVIQDFFDAEMDDKKNDICSFQFNFPRDSTFYDQIREGRFVRWNDTVFIIRIIEEYTQGKQHYVSVQAEHIMFELLDAFEPNFASVQNGKPADVLAGILNGTRFQAKSQLSDVFKVNIPQTKGAKLSIIDELVKDIYAIRVCTGLPDSSGMFTITLLPAEGESVAELIHNRKNTNQVTRIIDGKSVITRLYPYGSDGLTLEEHPDTNGNLYIDADTIGDYKLPREASVSFDNIADVQSLYQAAKDYLERNKDPKISYEVDVDFLEKDIGTGDRVLVIDEELDVRFQMLVTETTIVPYGNGVQRTVTLEEMIPSADRLIADIMLKQETDTGIRRGNVWTEFVTVPFSNEETTIDFSVPFKTKPVINCTVIGSESIQPTVEYIQSTLQDIPVYTGCKIHAPSGSGQQFCMLAFGRV